MNKSNLSKGGLNDHVVAEVDLNPRSFDYEPNEIPLLHSARYLIKLWWTLLVSNQGPVGYEPTALPLS